MFHKTTQISDLELAGDVSGTAFVTRINSWHRGSWASDHPRGGDVEDPHDASAMDWVIPGTCGFSRLSQAVAS